MVLLLIKKNCEKTIFHLFFSKRKIYSFTHSWNLKYCAKFTRIFAITNLNTIFWWSTPTLFTFSLQYYGWPFCSHAPIYVKYRTYNRHIITEVKTSILCISGKKFHPSIFHKRCSQNMRRFNSILSQILNTCTRFSEGLEFIKTVPTLHWMHSLTHSLSPSLTHSSNFWILCEIFLHAITEYNFWLKYYRVFQKFRKWDFNCTVATPMKVWKAEKHMGG